MSVWFAIPSARPADDALRCVKAWRERGYQVAVLRDQLDPEFASEVDLLTVPRGGYQGWAASVNLLAGRVLELDLQCQVVVTGGDDVWPAPRPAEEIESEFVRHFRGTLGVMQPDGHQDWSIRAPRIAWSPWLGREWCERAYCGGGPLWPQFKHSWADLELRELAIRLGVFWARPDLCQRHERVRGQIPGKRQAELHGAGDEALYHERSAAGFPGSDLAR